MDQNIQAEEIIVIGAGASGMMAALTAAKAGGKVLLLEKMARVGKKLLVTGNGRCNFTNRVQEDSCYRGNHRDFIQQALGHFSYQDVLSFFHELGILPMERNGYYYPASGQAETVADAFRRCLNDRRVRIHTEEPVITLKKTDRGYLLTSNRQTYRAGQVIVSVGGKAAPAQGTTGDGYRLAQELGLRLIWPLPALTSLKLKGDCFKEWAGVRCVGRCSLLCSDGSLLAEDLGELQMVNYGISGIPVFQVSRYAAVALDRGERPVLRLELLPDEPKEALETALEQLRKEHGKWTAADAINGLLPKKLGKLLIKSVGLDPGGSIRNWKDEDIRHLSERIKGWTFEVQAVSGFEKAQTTAGGVDTHQIDPDTMEVQGYPGLYMTGELLDVDGCCGGYNLQWAWTSGYLAGLAAGKQTITYSKRRK